MLEANKKKKSHLTFKSLAVEYFFSDKNRALFLLLFLFKTLSRPIETKIGFGIDAYICCFS